MRTPPFESFSKPAKSIEPLFVNVFPPLINTILSLIEPVAAFSKLPVNFKVPFVPFIILLFVPPFTLNKELFVTVPLLVNAAVTDVPLFTNTESVLTANSL